MKTLAALLLWGLAYGQSFTTEEVNQAMAVCQVMGLLAQRGSGIPAVNFDCKIEERQGGIYVQLYLGGQSISGAQYRLREIKPPPAKAG